MLFIWSSLGFLLFVPGPAGIFLGRLVSWWWPFVVLGLAPAFYFLALYMPDPNAHTSDGTAWGLVFLLYMACGAWGTVTAAIGVLIGRTRRESAS